MARYRARKIWIVAFGIILTIGMSFQVMAEGSRGLSGDPIWIFDPDLYVKHVETADLNDDNIADIIAAEYDMTYYGNLSRVYAIDGPTGDTLR